MPKKNLWEMVFLFHHTFVVFVNKLCEGVLLTNLGCIYMYSNGVCHLK